MKKKEKNDLLIVGGIIAGILLLSSKAVTGGKTIDVDSDFVIEGYRDLITTSTPENRPLMYNGVPLYIYLARNTHNYQAVRDSYNATYRGNMTEELTSKLAGYQLAEYVAELLKNGQLIF
ncbi:MAG: hypothetical protein ABIN80_28665 [Dyadobacter sp.]|uniref:hypothetical protein n=1 Tax=Dyadobacter sp. TaxID=1914288 RepID=UPI0032655448